MCPQIFFACIVTQAVGDTTGAYFFFEIERAMDCWWESLFFFFFLYFLLNVGDIINWKNILC